MSQRTLLLSILFVFPTYFTSSKLCRFSLQNVTNPMDVHSSTLISLVQADTALHWTITKAFQFGSLFAIYPFSNLIPSISSTQKPWCFFSNIKITSPPRQNHQWFLITICLFYSIFNNLTFMWDAQQNVIKCSILR